MTLLILLEIPGIIHVGKIYQRRVEIDIVIHVIADEMIEPEQSAEGDDRIENIRVTKEEICSMIGAHTHASRHEFLIRISAMLAHEGNDFPHDITIVILMAARPVGRVCAKICPGLAVYTVHRK